MRLIRVPGTIWLLAAGALRRFLRMLIRPLFAQCGRNVKFNPFDRFSYGTIRMGNDVFINTGACFSAKKGITIGDKVMFGANVTIRGGDHNTSKLGEYMADVQEKGPEDDQPVFIDDNVWVGTSVVILKGVTVGRGSIVAAGAVVVRDVAPYSTIGGVPAKLIRYRWSLAQVLEHEKILYSPECQLDVQALSHLNAVEL